MEYINLKERKDILTLGFKDEDGNILKDKNGKEVYIEFDLGDIELPSRYNNCVKQINKARTNLKNQFIIINKKQDFKRKNEFLTNNEIEKTNALKQFYKEMENAMDLFLGAGGTRKFLNGKNPYYEMWDDIDEAIKPFEDKLKLTVSGIENRIKEKYNLKEAESDILKDE